MIEILILLNQHLYIATTPCGFWSSNKWLYRSVLHKYISQRRTNVSLNNPLYFCLCHYIFSWLSLNIDGGRMMWSISGVWFHEIVLYVFQFQFPYTCILVSVSIHWNIHISQVFSPSGDQPKWCILACKQNNQLLVVKQYFTNIAAIYSMGVI